MNTHVTDEVRNKHPEYEFRGKPWTRGNFTWIHGYHKTLQVTYRVCLELSCGADPAMYEFICSNGYFG